MQTYQTSNYNELAATLSLQQLDISAAEVHGAITGVTCGMSGTADVDDILALVIQRDQEIQTPELLSNTLESVLSETTKTLHEGGFEFRLLLPDEASELDYRTEAIADWCQGFVLGLLNDGRMNIEDLPGEAGEAARDIMTIAEAQSGVDDEQTEEDALVEIEEFLRISAQLIYEELHPGNTPGED